MRVVLDYRIDSDAGNDMYRYRARDEALAKFDELKRLVRAHEPPHGEPHVTHVDEPDFYGFQLDVTGDYMRVYITD